MVKKIFYMDDSNIRLDKWLQEKMPDFSRNQIANLIKAKKIIYDENQFPKSKDILPENTKIIVRYEEIEALPSPEDIPLNIIYEDQDFIVLNKPIHLAVHPGAGNPNHTLVNALLYYTDELSTINDINRPGIVHRLDKDTSGILLVCKNNKIHQAMADLFKKHQVKRVYRALVWGQPDEDQGIINAPIGRDPVNKTRMAVQPDGKKAITKFQVMQRFTNQQNQPIASELKLNLYTGRTHQIRVHLSYLNLPIIGDPLYHKGRKNLGIPAQALFSSELAFSHPFNGKEMQFQIEPPDFYQELRGKLLQHII